MVQRTITSGGLSDLATRQATIDSLKVNMQSGKIIYRSDMVSLVNLWNSWASHSHSITDRYGIANYGNTNPPGYSSTGSNENDTSNGPTFTTAGGSTLVGVGGLTAPAVNAVISHSLINAMANSFQNGLNHYHGWDDRSS
jgi:hypothetical protein